MRLLKRFFAHCVCICLAHCFRLIIFWDKPQQVSTKKLFWGSCVTVSVKASPAKTDRQPSGDFGQPTQKESIDHEKASSFCPMLSVFESFKKILGHFIRVSKVGNICFLSPLVSSIQEYLALLSLYVLFDIIVNFTIQKLKNKHIFIKKYTNWAKLNFLILTEREETKTRYFAPQSSLLYIRLQWRRESNW